MTTTEMIEHIKATMPEPCLHGVIMLNLPDVGWVAACDGCGEQPSRLANDGIEAACYCCSAR